MVTTRPVRNQDDLLFWAGAAERRLVVQRCEECGVLRHPPTPMCASCGSVAVGSHECAGHGRVLSWIFSDHPNRQKGDAEAERRLVVLVELDEGLRIVSNLMDAPGPGPYNDLEVEVDFLEADDAVLPVFRAVGADALPGGGR